MRQPAILLIAAAVLGLCSCARPADVPNIAAASDLKFAMEEIAEGFQAETGRRVDITFGSSGNFYTQIRQGAPFEMFLSADEAFVQRLDAEGLTTDEGALYAIGRIVLFTPTGSPVVADADMADLQASALDGRLKKLAIANPEHAPYGRAAAEALRSRGLWEAVEGRLVLGENVSQAAQFATTSSAEAGIFAYSLALAPAVGDQGEYVLLPAQWHAPLRQRMVLMKHAGPVARQLYDHMRQPAARAVLERYGFSLPAGED